MVAPGSEPRGGALVVGATSGMGQAIARRLAQEGIPLILAGRDMEALERQAKDLQVRFRIDVEVRAFEALRFESHAEFWKRCVEHFDGELEGVMLCHGEMPEQEDAARDFSVARRMIDINYVSMVSLLNLAAQHFEQRGHGWIAALSSVAGDRGRPSNYLYGSTKSALSAVLSGMRARLDGRGIVVVDVRPGFVDTGLTWGRPGMFLVASPDRVARDVIRGITRNRAIVYTPCFWLGIMFIIRAIPEFVFRKLKL